MTDENRSRDDSEAEETPSLCDLPLQGDSIDNSDTLQNSSDQGIFEFYNTTKTETMRAADDIIFGGKLLPYKSSSSVAAIAITDKSSRFLEDQRFNHTRRNILHRKSESLNNLQRSQSTAKERLARSSHSLNYRKLHRDSTPRIVTSSNHQISCKPKWSALAFGFMKSPAEMELKDIRNRQSRRNPSSWFPNQEMVSVRKDEDKGSWKLLRVLSCKGEANGVISEALTCIRHV